MTSLNLQGYALAFLAVCWYNYQKLRGMQQAPASVAAPAVSDRPTDQPSSAAASLLLAVAATDALCFYGCSSFCVSSRRATDAEAGAGAAGRPRGRPPARWRGRRWRRRRRRGDRPHCLGQRRRQQTVRERAGPANLVAALFLSSAACFGFSVTPAPLIPASVILHTA